MTTFQLTLTMDAKTQHTADDCDHAILLGIVRRALLGSHEFRLQYGGQLVGLATEVSDSMNPEPYRSAFRA